MEGDLLEGTTMVDGWDEVIPAEGGMMEGRSMEATPMDGELPEGTTVADGWDEAGPVEGQLLHDTGSANLSEENAAAAIQAQTTDDWSGDDEQVRRR